jgi:hypothetical protein
LERKFLDILYFWYSVVPLGVNGLTLKSGTDTGIEYREKSEQYLIPVFSIKKKVERYSIPVFSTKKNQSGTQYRYLIPEKKLSGIEYRYSHSAIFLSGIGP